MRFFVLKLWDKMREWTLKWSHSPHMVVALFFIAVSEAILFPIPPDVLLIAILLINSERWWFYSSVVAAGSVIGSALGYLIGLSFYNAIGIRIISLYGLGSAVDLIGAKFAQYTFIVVFSAAFTPIPFKVAAIAGGLFRVPFLPLILGAILGRGLRYFLVGYIIKLYGKQLNNLIYKYFNIFSLVFVFLLIGGFFAIKLLF